jgi:hypothetical protein
MRQTSTNTVLYEYAKIIIKYYVIFLYGYPFVYMHLDISIRDWLRTILTVLRIFKLNYDSDEVDILKL